MIITWDDKKESINIAKHGISFIEAASVLSNPSTLSNINKHIWAQERFYEKAI